MNSIPSLLLDSKLLYVFVEIYRQNSVSEAALRLNLTQPAVSLSLRRLREHFDNPLFTRIGNEMLGTALAHDLYPKFVAAIQALESTYLFDVEFDPKTSATCFTLMMSDIGDMVLLPDLYKLSQQEAPSIQFYMQSSQTNLKEKMQLGALDIAVGFFPELEAGFYHKRLINQYYVGLVRADHPRLELMINDAMVYFDEKHIDVSNYGREYSLIEQELQSSSHQRNIMLRLSNFLGLSRLLLSSDLVATVPKMLAEKLCEEQDLKMFSLPLDCYSYPIYAYWHEKRHKDRDHIWLRNMLFKASEGK